MNFAGKTFTIFLYTIALSAIGEAALSQNLKKGCLVLNKQAGKINRLQKCVIEGENSKKPKVTLTKGLNTAGQTSFRIAGNDFKIKLDDPSCRHVDLVWTFKNDPSKKRAQIDKVSAVANCLIRTKRKGKPSKIARISLNRGNYQKNIVYVPDETPPVRVHHIEIKTSSSSPERAHDSNYSVSNDASAATPASTEPGIAAIPETSSSDPAFMGADFPEDDEANPFGSAVETGLPSTASARAGAVPPPMGMEPPPPPGFEGSPGASLMGEPPAGGELGAPFEGTMPAQNQPFFPESDG